MSQNKSKLLIRPTPGRIQHQVTPQSANWQHLSFAVQRLKAGETLAGNSLDQEILFTFLSGSAKLVAGKEQFEFVGRSNVFSALPHALYVPPESDYSIVASTDCEIAFGAAPAQGLCPIKFFAPTDFKLEARGGANVSRHITHLIAPPDCEKLFVFEVYTPSGNWSGFPPHRHDGRMGSSYLEETYYFKVQPENGFGSMRVYTGDTDLDEFMLVQHNDLILVPEGYHPSNAAPGSNLYFLNYLAGPNNDYTVINDPAFDWLKNDWTGKPLVLPLKTHE